MSRAKLTVCVIARNEQEQMEGCLASARELADEIIVVDTGSTDATCDISRRMGARVIDSPWEDDFSRARNAGLDAVRTPWVLMLDADERIEEMDTAALRRQLDDAGPDDDAFSVRIDNQLDGGGVNACRIVRLFRSRPEIRYRGRIHEEVVTSIADLRGGPIQPPAAEMKLVHSGYLAEVRGSRNKRARNLRLLRTAIKTDPRRAWMHLAYARELLMMCGERIFPGEHFGEAVQHLEEARQATLAEATPLHLVAAIVATLAATRTADFRPQEALAILAEGPPVPDGSAEQVLIDFARARARLAAAGEDRDLLRCALADFESLDGRVLQPGFIDVDARLTGTFARERRAEATGRLGDHEAAMRILDAAAAEHAGYGGVCVRQAELLLLEGDVQAGLKAYTEGLKRDPYEPDAWLGTARLLNMLGELDQAAECANNALQIVPQWGAAVLERAIARLLQDGHAVLLEEFAPQREAIPEADVACLLAEALSGRPVTGLRGWPAPPVERAMMVITRGLAGGGRPDLLRTLKSAFGSEQTGATPT